MKKIIIIIMVIFVSAFLPAEQASVKAETLTPTIITPQCAMCRAVLESEEDNSTAKGINNGIKYLMVIPYILVGGVFYFIYKSRKKDTEAISEDSFSE